jgi:hypothetical protein
MAQQIGRQSFARLAKKVTSKWFVMYIIYVRERALLSTHTHTDLPRGTLPHGRLLES